MSNVVLQFPYALKALPETLEAKWDSQDFAQYRDGFPEEYRSSRPALTAHVEDLVARDVKAPYLKSLQGYLWETGYRSGELTAPLFADVAPRLAAWRKESIQIMIYSSGSVPAQKLLFKHTNGQPRDLMPLITDFFDTVNAGPKVQAASYEKIAAKYPQYPAEAWLFLSDNLDEVRSAIDAGMQSFVVQRPGNPELPTGTEERFKVVGSFDELESP